MMPRVINLYIAWRFTVMLTMILVAIAVVAVLADYMEVLRHHSDDDGFTALLGLQLSGMQVLVQLDLLLPFVFLFGAVISLIDLSRKSELVVARASGVSIWGCLRGPLAVAVLFGALATAGLNPLAVSLKHRADNIEAELSAKAPQKDGHWFRQTGSDGRQSIVRAGSAADDGRTLFGVTAFVLEPDGSFREKVTAPRAEYAGNRWLLRDATVLSAARPQHQVGTYELPTRLSLSQIQRSFIRPSAVSVWSLPGFIETAKRTGLDSNQFRVAFHTLLNRPLMLVAMVLIAATVSLRPARHGGAWRLVLVGAGLGFLLYAGSEVVSDLGGNGIVNPVLAAWLPPIAALTFGATALLYQEDG